MDLRDYLRLLRRRWLHILLIAAVAAGAQILSLGGPRPSDVFTSSTELLLKETILEQGGLATAAIGITVLPLKTRIDLIATPVVGERASRLLAERRITVSDSDIRQRIRVATSQEGHAVTISATGASPVESMEIANAVAAAFRDWYQEDVTDHYRRTREVLHRQLGSVQELFDRQTRDVQVFLREKLRAGRARPDLQFERRINQAVELENQKASLEDELLALGRRLQNGAAGLTGTDLLPETSRGLPIGSPRPAGPSEALAALQGQLADQHKQLATLRTTRTDAHPDVAVLQKQVRTSLHTIDEASAAAVEERRAGLLRQREELQARLHALTDKIRSAWDEIDRLQEPMEGYGELVAARNATRGQRQGILDELLRIDQREALEGGPARVTIVRAAGPGSPVPAPPGLSFGLVAAVSLVLGVTGAYFLEAVQSALRTSADVRTYLDLPTLASIPELPADQVSLLRLALKSPVYELYNKLAMFLESSAAGQRARILAFVSTKAGEGKSTIASNVAISLAQAGRRIILIDADLRRPVQHQIFGLDNARGLSGILAGEIDDARRLHETAGGPEPRLDTYLQPTTIPHLHVITAGPVPMNPVLQLRSARFPRLLDELKPRTDLILLDSPPLLGVVDGAILGGLADLTVLIVGENRVTRGEAGQGKHALTQVEATVAGAIINRVHFQPEAYYYYYYHYRGYA